jgi:hypothetical protein
LKAYKLCSNSSKSLHTVNVLVTRMFKRPIIVSELECLACLLLVLGLFVNLSLCPGLLGKNGQLHPAHVWKGTQISAGLQSGRRTPAANQRWLHRTLETPFPNSSHGFCIQVSPLGNQGPVFLRYFISVYWCLA